MLIDNGIEELPRHVRWDNSEAKFVIEKHPILVQEVQQGKRKKAVMSGTKSKSLTVVQKYQDILARLQELDGALAPDNDGFTECRQINKREYEEICECINMYENRVHTTNVPEKVTTDTSTMEAVRNTPQGKKTVANLPENCGVKQDDIPKYCYYRAATSGRGDCFVIDKHPALVQSGKRTWNTTTKISKTTQDKFQDLIAKLSELDMASSTS
jgi:hypothetical protein